MVDYAFLAWAPLVSAVVWFTMAAYQVLQERYRTWTEVFFLALCLSAGAYGLSDAVFFSAPIVGSAKAAAVASLTSLTFGAFFIFLYGMTLHNRFRRGLLLGLLPTAFFVVTFPERMFAGFASLSGGGAPYVPVYDPLWFAGWVLSITVLAGLGVWGLYRTFREVRALNAQLAGRLYAILWGLVIAAGLGVATNAVPNFLGITLPPMFSTTLAIPGLLLFSAVSPTSFQRLNATLLRRKAATYAIRGVFLTYADGTVIGSRIAPEEQMVDADSFSATLDVIQNFMRTSFPMLRGKWLQSIRHGDYTLVMERGQYAYVTMVLRGEENDQLRRLMLHHLDAFEAQNRGVLEDWRGVAGDAAGVDEMLASLIAGE